LSRLDPLPAALQCLIDADVLKQHHFYYRFSSNIARFLLHVSDPAKSRLAQPDDDHLSFLRSVLHVGGQKLVRLLRGPGFVSSGRLEVDLDRFNLPLPPLSKLRATSMPFTSANGVQAHLLRVLNVRIKHDPDLPALSRTPKLVLVPHLLLRDGTALSAGCEPDKASNTIVGANCSIDKQFIEAHPDPSPELINDILFVEAVANIVVTACGSIFQPLGHDFVVKKGGGKDVCHAVILRARQAQICLRCLQKFVKCDRLVITEDGSGCCNHCGGACCCLCLCYSLMT
jgi:hypothetical protein